VLVESAAGGAEVKHSIGIVIALGLVGAAAGAAESGAPRATAAGEALEGVWLAPDEAVFRGIPYAAAPVGDLRWRPPAPHSARQGTQSAREFGPACVQTDRLVVWEKSIATAFGTQDKVDAALRATSEDCLFLNVWTASLNARSPAPVMVWIHGGSNVNGEGSSPWCDGRGLARRGVVVVTINYRLGVFGFLAHPELSAESAHHVSGNYALLDQLEALRWVKANIRAFGGDPARVTVFGESAGSIDLLTLMTAPAAEGLFERAIAESGVPLFATPRLAAAEAQGGELARAAGADSIAALRAKPAADILQLADTLTRDGRLNAGPVVDGWLLPDHPGRSLATGKQSRVPLVVGSNAREMTTLTRLLPTFERNVAGYRRWLAQTAGPAAERLEEIYPAASDADVQRALVDAFTDLAFTCPSRFAAHAMTRIDAPAYLYQFTRVPPGGDSLGAYHGAEISYVFGSRLPWLPRAPVDDRLATVMQRYWVAFASTGKPAAEGLAAWPAHDAADRHLELGPSVATSAGLAQPACDIFDQLYPTLWGSGR
jgi:para-nitrobenzyl esterase